MRALGGALAHRARSAGTLHSQRLSRTTRGGRESARDRERGERERERESESESEGESERERERERSKIDGGAPVHESAACRAVCEDKTLKTDRAGLCLPLAIRLYTVLTAHARAPQRVDAHGLAGLRLFPPHMDAHHARGHQP